MDTNPNLNPTELYQLGNTIEELEHALREDFERLQTNPELMEQAMDYLLEEMEDLKVRLVAMAVEYAACTLIIHATSVNIFNISNG